MLVYNKHSYKIWCFFDRASYYRLISSTNFNAQLFYSLTVCMLHYNPRHVSSINMPIFRRTNCIITASGIVALCKRLYSMPDAVIIQFVLLKMGMLMLEICRGFFNVTYILLMNKELCIKVGKWNTRNSYKILVGKPMSKIPLRGPGTDRTISKLNITTISRVLSFIYTNVCTCF